MNSKVNRNEKNIFTCNRSVVIDVNLCARAQSILQPVNGQLRTAIKRETPTKFKAAMNPVAAPFAATLENGARKAPASITNGAHYTPYNMLKIGIFYSEENAAWGYSYNLPYLFGQAYFGGYIPNLGSNWTIGTNDSPCVATYFDAEGNFSIANAQMGVGGFYTPKIWSADGKYSYFYGADDADKPAYSVFFGGTGEEMELNVYNMYADAGFYTGYSNTPGFGSREFTTDEGKHIQSDRVLIDYGKQKGLVVNKVRMPLGTVANVPDGPIAEGKEIDVFLSVVSEDGEEALYHGVMTSENVFLSGSWYIADVVFTEEDEDGFSAEVSPVCNGDVTLMMSGFMQEGVQCEIPMVYYETEDYVPASYYDQWVDGVQGVEEDGSVSFYTNGVIDAAVSLVGYYNFLGELGTGIDVFNVTAPVAGEGGFSWAVSSVKNGQEYNDFDLESTFNYDEWDFEFDEDVIAGFDVDSSYLAQNGCYLLYVAVKDLPAGVDGRTTTVKITSKESATCTINIKQGTIADPVPVEDLDVIFAKDTLIYNGTPQQPSYVLGDPSIEKNLTKTFYKSENGSYQQIKENEVISSGLYLERFTYNSPSGRLEATNYFEIMKAPIQIKVIDAVKEYGEENPPFSVVYDGFVNEETAESQGVFIANPTFVTSADKNANVGSYVVNATNAVLTNYEPSYNPGILTVYKAPLTLIAMDKFRVYGDENPAFDVDYSGLKNNNVESALTVAPTFLCSATVESNVGEYPIEITGAQSINYNLDYRNGSLSVEKADLVIAAPVLRREYGESNPEFTIEYTGFKNNESSLVLISQPIIECSATIYSDCGNYPIEVSGAEADNYSICYNDGSLTVDKANLIVHAFDASRKYGEENPEFSLEYTGFKNNDGIEKLEIVPIAETTASAASNVGTYTITVSGGSALNYELNYQEGQLNIEKAPLLISANDCSRKYGQENPVFGFTYSGFVNNDNQNCLSSMPIAECETNQLSPIGRYEIVPCGADALNYEISYGVGNLDILKEMLTVIAYNAQQEYGEEMPELKYLISGFVNNETESDLSSLPLIECAAGVSSPAGQYPIVTSGADAMNYDFKYVDGILTITKAPLSVSAVNASRCYGVENPDFELSYSGFKNEDTETILTTMPHAYTNATETSNVGNYAIYVTGGFSDRYSISYYNGVLSIEKASQEIVWEQEFNDVKLNDQIPLNVYATSGLELSWELSDESLGEIYISENNYVLDCKKVGTLTIRAMQNGNGNYKPATRIVKTIEILDSTGLELVYGNNGLVDVYNAQGAKVKSQVRRNEALMNLPQGVYIIEGQKKFVGK